MKRIKIILSAAIIYQALAIAALQGISNLEIPVVNYSASLAKALMIAEASTPIKSKKTAIKSNLIISNMLLNSKENSFSDILTNGFDAYKHMDEFLNREWKNLDQEERFDFLLEELIILNRPQIISKDEKIKLLQTATYYKALAHRNYANQDDALYFDVEAILSDQQEETHSSTLSASGNLLAIRELYSGISSCKIGNEQGASGIDYFNKNYGKSKPETVFFISRNWNAPLLAFLHKHATSPRCADSLKNVINNL